MLGGGQEAGDSQLSGISHKTHAEHSRGTSSQEDRAMVRFLFLNVCSGHVVDSRLEERQSGNWGKS